MRALVIGGGGPIGRAVTECLRAQSQRAFWTSRQAPTEAGQLQANRSRPDEIEQIVRTHGIDTVIDMTAYSLATTEPLLSRLGGQAIRYVLISSSDVYRNYGLLHRIEAGEPAHHAVDEASALRSSRYPYRSAPPRDADDPERWMDDYDKIPIEDAVQNLACDWTILRLPMVYGPGDRQRRFRWAIQPMLAGAEVLHAPRAWLEWTTTYGFIDNVAGSIVHAAGHPDAARSILNVADAPLLNHRQWLELFGSVAGWKGRVEASDMPTPLARATGGLDLNVPFRVSADRLLRGLAYSPAIDLQTAASRTVADEMAQIAIKSR